MQDCPLCRLRRSLPTSFVHTLHATRSSFAAGCAVIFAGVIASSASLHAADGTWGANSLSDWYTGSNWAGGSYPGLQGAAASNTDTATFTSAFTGTTVGINMGTASLNLGAISIDSTRTTATNIGNSSGTAGVLRLYGATVNGNENTILRNAGTGLLTLQAAQSGTMGVVLSNTTDNKIYIDGTGGITISSIISGANNLSLNGAGSGVLTLTGANTYDGLTSIGATSAVSIRNATALGSTTGGTTIGSGGQLQLQGGITVGDEALTLGGTGPLNQGALLNKSGTNNYGGLLTLSAATRINSDAGALNLTNAGTITGAYGLTFGGSGVISVTSIISTGANGVTKDGSATVTLSGVNTYTGVTSVSAGVLRLDNAGALPGGIGATGGTSGLTISGGGLVGLGNGDFTRGLGTGAEQVQFTGNGGFAAYTADRTVNLGGASAGVVWNSTASFLTTDQSLILGAAGADKTVTFQNPIDFNAAVRTIQVENGSAAVDATLSGVLSGASGGLTKTGAGTLSLSAANTYTGETTVSAGVLLLNNVTALSGGLAGTGGTSALTISGGVVGLGNGNFARGLGTGVTQVRFTGSGGFAAYTADRVVNLGGATASVTWGSTANFLTTGQSLILGAADADKTVSFQNPISFNGAVRTVQVDDGSAAVDAILNGVLSNGGLTKTGAGTLTLTATSSTYSGVTTISGGVLSVATIGNGAGNLGAANSAAANLVLNNGTLRYTGATASTLRAFTLTAGATGTFDITTNNLTISGAAANTTGALTKIGAGTLTLSGANGYTGTTTISGGVLSVATIGNGDVAGNLGQASNAAANLVLNNGTLKYTGATASTDRAFTLTAGATGTFEIAANNLTISGAAANTTGALTKTGAGTLTLGGANLYTGVTTVSAGVLRLDHAAALRGGIGSTGGTSGLTIGGGVVGLGNGDFTRGLGTDVTQVQFTGSGGFAAYTADRTVNLGGASAGVTWGSTASFLITAQNLILGWADADKTVTFANSIDFGGAARTIQVENGSAAVDATLSGVLSNGNLTKNGTGTLSLSAANTFSGAVTVSGGILQAGASSSVNTSGPFGAAGLISVGSGTAVDMAGFSFTSGHNQAFSIRGTGVSGKGAITNSSSTTSTIIGPITFAAAATISGDAGLLNITGAIVSANTAITLGGATGGSISSVVAGTRTVTKTEAGTWTLSGTNGYTGLTTVSAGTLAYGVTDALSNGAVTVSGGTLDIGAFSDSVGAVTLSGGGAITGTTGVLAGSSYALQKGSASAILAGAGAVNKTTADTVTLTGVNTFTGTTTVSGGVLRLDSAGALSGGIGSTGGLSALTMSGGVVGLGNGDFTRDLGTGVTQVQFTGSGGFAAYTADRTVNLGGASAGVTWNTGSFVPTGQSLILGAAGADKTVTFANSIDFGSAVRTVQVDDGSATVDAILSGVLSGASGGLTKTGAGTLSLSAANTYSGVTTVSGGVLRATTSASALGAGALSLGGGTLELANDTGLAFNRDTTVTASSTIKSERLTAGAGVTHTLGTLSIGAQTLTVGTDASVTSGTAGLIFGSTTLSATGATFSASAGTLLTLGAVSGDTFGFTVTGDGNTTIGGIIGTGAGTLTKNGAGILTLSGANTYSGGTLLNTGSLVAGHASAFGTGSITVASGSTLDFSSLAISNVINNNGGTLINVGTIANANLAAGTTTLSGTDNTVATVSGSATVVISGTGTGTSITSMTGGTVNTAADITVESYTGGNIDNTAALTIQSGNSAGVISGTGSLTKTGAGTLTLSGTSSYTGSTTVSAGKLIVNGSTSASSAIGVSNGGILAGSGTVGGSATIASGGALAPGNSPGVLTVDGNLAFASGSIFEWELDLSKPSVETNRGVAYDGVNVGRTLSGSNAIFKIILTGTQDYTDSFWNQTREWTDIFKTANGSTTLSNWAGVFGGGFQYAYNGQTVAPISAGSFAVSGNSLTWSAVPEPSNLLAGMLAASALLRRRRQG
ncbi:MAG: autotransporter-associated beta strand repeat-containing protein [Akkermansiaceae bacterium]